MAATRPNRLIHETSPYLLQHAHNPVDWYAWGDEALATARDADRPIFLSIGYSACHWCHVMEHESFEDAAIAQLMNELFVNIKVDREERPDLDDIYMQAVQLFSGGHGGWPMSVFLTPALEPYFGGTYFPPADRHGMPGFRTVLQFAADAYRDQKENVAQTTTQVVDALRQMAVVQPAAAVPGPEMLDAAFQAFVRSFDAHDGGFGSAPKFPHAMGIAWLLREHDRRDRDMALEMARHSLVQMARGGIYDQLGGGFHRYSTDAHWLVPHFEKMLYDNALLARTYVEASQACDDAFFAGVAREIFAYVEREMTSPEGGFYSAQDADSEGVEGKYFVWTPSQITDRIGAADARIVCRYWSVGERGSFEGDASVLAVRRDPEVIARELGITPAELAATVARARGELLEVRATRIPPGRDDKIIVAWNGLMISALSRAAAAWGDAELLHRAGRAADFLWSQTDGEHLYRTWKDGRAKGDGFLDDYAGFIAALLDLYEASFEPRWYERAARLNEVVMREFWDESAGGFFYTGHKHETLLARTRAPFDNATPSGNSLQVTNLLRLAAFDGTPRWRDAAGRTLQLLGDALGRYPTGMAEMLSGLDLYLGPQVQVAVAGRGPAAEALVRETFGRFRPRKVVAGWPATGDPAPIALLAQREPVGGKPAAHVCREFVCRLPVSDPAALATALDAASAVQP